MKKFEQLKKLYQTMTEEYTTRSSDKKYISGITADFDRLFELAWKTTKEYLLKSKGMIQAKSGSPTDIIKLAYSQNLIDDEAFWLQLLADRNDDSHHYNESEARSYAARIERDYLGKLGEYIENLKEFIPEENILVEIPQDFLDACDKRNMFYDEYLHELMKKYSYTSDLELFENWDTIKHRELGKGLYE